MNSNLYNWGATGIVPHAMAYAYAHQQQAYAQQQWDPHAGSFYDQQAGGFDGYGEAGFGAAGAAGPYASYDYSVPYDEQWQQGYEEAPVEGYGYGMEEQQGVYGQLEDSAAAAWQPSALLQAAAYSAAATAATLSSAQEALAAAAKPLTIKPPPPAAPAVSKPAASNNSATSSSSTAAKAAAPAGPPQPQLPKANPISAGQARKIEEELMALPSMSSLAARAPRWVVVLNSGPGGRGPQAGGAQQVVSGEELVKLRRQRRLQVQTLIVGVQGAGSLPQPLPAAFFRPLQLLVAMQAAGYPYQPPTLAQLRSGAPQPGWCLPALLFSASDEQAGGGAGSAAAPPTPAALHSTAKQLLGQWSYAAPVYTYTESGSWRCPGSINPSVVASQLDDARVTEWTPVLGLAESLPRGVWVPTSLCLPLGAVAVAVAQGLRYHALPLADIHAVNANALLSGRPLPRPAAAESSAASGSSSAAKTEQGAGSASTSISSTAGKAGAASAALGSFNIGAPAFSPGSSGQSAAAAPGSKPPAEAAAQKSVPGATAALAAAAVAVALRQAPNKQAAPTAASEAAKGKASPTPPALAASSAAASEGSTSGPESGCSAPAKPDESGKADSSSHVRSPWAEPAPSSSAAAEGLSVSLGNADWGAPAAPAAAGIPAVVGTPTEPQQKQQQQHEEKQQPLSKQEEQPRQRQQQEPLRLPQQEERKQQAQGQKKSATPVQAEQANDKQPASGSTGPSTGAGPAKAPAGPGPAQAGPASKPSPAAAAPVPVPVPTMSYAAKAKAAAGAGAGLAKPPTPAGSKPSAVASKAAASSSTTSTSATQGKGSGVAAAGGPAAGPTLADKQAAGARKAAGTPTPAGTPTAKPAQPAAPGHGSSSQAKPAAPVKSAATSSKQQAQRQKGRSKGAAVDLEDEDEEEVVEIDADARRAAQREEAMARAVSELSRAQADMEASQQRASSAALHVARTVVGSGLGSVALSGSVGGGGGGLDTQAGRSYLGAASPAAAVSPHTAAAAAAAQLLPSLPVVAMSALAAESGLGGAGGTGLGVGLTGQVASNLAAPGAEAQHVAVPLPVPVPRPVPVPVPVLQQQQQQGQEQEHAGNSQLQALQPVAAAAGISVQQPMQVPTSLLMGQQAQQPLVHIQLPAGIAWTPAAGLQPQQQLHLHVVPQMAGPLSYQPLLVKSLPVPAPTLAQLPPANAVPLVARIQQRQQEHYTPALAPLSQQALPSQAVMPAGLPAASQMPSQVSGAASDSSISSSGDSSGSSMLRPLDIPASHFETCLFRLFQGDGGERMWSTEWWLQDGALTAGSGLIRVRGPFTGEQMMLAFVGSELSSTALLAGTEVGAVTHHLQAASNAGAALPVQLLKSLTLLFEEAVAGTFQPYTRAQLQQAGAGQVQ